jgi:hypothetical protein
MGEGYRPGIGGTASGNGGAARQYARWRRRTLREGLAPAQRPALGRGDNAFGTEPVMAEREALEQA